MLVRGHNAFGSIQEFKATSVVVFDDLGNPIVVVIRTGPGSVVYATVEHPDFNDILRNFGISKRVEVTDFDPKSLIV